ncbi:sensor histidine kinase [Candidatus Wolfebacteria bacterium]|nr:sensor histidine kinase [Candidatus Wolfebacteria bacterium]
MNINFLSDSITGKFIKLFFIFCIIFLLFGFLILYFIKIESGEYAVSFQNYKVKEEAEIIGDFIGKTLDDLKSFYVLKNDIAKNDFSLTLTHIYQLFLVNKSIEEVKIVSPDGFEMLGVSRTRLFPKKELKSVKEDIFFKTAKSGNIFIGDAILDGQNVYFDIAAPYFDNFQLTAVVLARVNLKYFFDGIILEDMPGGGHLHILNKNGIILAAPDGRYVGNDVSSTDLFKKIKESKEGVAGIKCNPCVEKHDFNIIASAHEMESQPYFIVVSENSEDNVFGLYYRVRNIFLETIVLILFIYIAAFWIFNSRLKKQIQVLTDGVFRFHEGKYSEKIVLKTGDELEYIAWHLNHLASKIEQNIEDKNKFIEKLKEIDVLKFNFIKTISHQLRTPISSMLWLLENLIRQMSEKLTSEQKNILNDVYGAGQNINQIVNDMILMADIDDKKITLEKSKANCEDIINSAILAIQSQAREKNIIIEYQKSKTPLPDCEKDVRKLKFVFERVLDNAVKYSESGKKVIIKSEIKDRELIFSVVDQGIGISQAEQPKIFTKFYRASNAYKLIQNASGLSLYIAKYFIELHGGKIWFQSQENKGSTFYISLPIKSA